MPRGGDRTFIQAVDWLHNNPDCTIAHNVTMYGENGQLMTVASYKEHVADRVFENQDGSAKMFDGDGKELGETFPSQLIEGLPLDCKWILWLEE